LTDLPLSIWLDEFNQGPLHRYFKLTTREWARRLTAVRQQLRKANDGRPLCGRYYFGWTMAHWAAILVEERAGYGERMAEAWRGPGRPPDDGSWMATLLLAIIFEEYTGKTPTQITRHILPGGEPITDTKDRDKGSPFYRFAQACFAAVNEECPAALKQATFEFQGKWDWYADFPKLREWLWGGMTTLSDLEAELQRVQEAGQPRRAARLTRQVEAWRARERKIAIDDVAREQERAAKRPDVVAKHARTQEERAARRPDLAAKRAEHARDGESKAVAELAKLLPGVVGALYADTAQSGADAEQAAWTAERIAKADPTHQQIESKRRAAYLRYRSKQGTMGEPLLSYHQWRAQGQEPPE
jgi:hypothetical protein